jgi:fatty-acid desaturase
MRVYNLVGYGLLVLHVGLSVVFAPPALGPWLGLLAGSTYLLFIWFSGGVYLSNVIHMGIAHRALNFKPWFVKTLAVAYNLTSIYINPVTWVNRHRHHHAFSDHDGDPNKGSDDGFWRTLYRCVLPYRCRSNFSSDPILRTRPFRLVSNPFFALFAQCSSYGLLWWAVQSWTYAIVLWCSVRVFALWVNMLQNYWSHDREFGTRRYDDQHNHAVNLSDWLPVTATFSACWHNNHHHHPQLLRLSHDASEYDFGFQTIRAMKAFGLVEASATGARLPADVPLTELGF